MTKDLENMADALPVPGDTETRAIPTVPVTGTHTPGPWRSDPSGQHIRSASNQAVARVYDVEPYSITETEANARLIAAAPDLLEALKQAEVYTHTSASVRALVNAAIAKAEGRP